MEKEFTMNDGFLKLKGIEPTPFSISFRWLNEEITIVLKNGEDILKVANLFSKMLTDNYIEHTIKQQDNGN